MFGKRLGIGTGLTTVMAVSVVAMGAGVADSNGPPAWQKGLQARSEALNQKYGLPSSKVGCAEHVRRLERSAA